jgi:hypothetical protein
MEKNSRNNNSLGGSLLFASNLILEEEESLPAVDYTRSAAMSNGRDAPGDLDEELHVQVVGVNTGNVAVDELEDKQVIVSETFDQDGECECIKPPQ